MHRLLYEYHLDLTTWTYLAGLLTITVYFKFGQIFRIRNLDLLALTALSPGLILTQTPAWRTAGYLWLFGLGALLLTRLLLDSLMVRRPLLEANLNLGGMSFLGAALVVFLTMHSLTRPAERDFVWPREPGTDQVGRAGEPVRLLLPICGNPLLKLCEAPAPPPVIELSAPPVPPGSAAVAALPGTATAASAPAKPTGTAPETPPFVATPEDIAAEEATAGKTSVATALPGTVGGAKIAAARTPFLQGNRWGRIVGVLAHFGIAAGLIVLGTVHFKNVATGIGTAVLFLLLPGTALMLDRIDHAVPALCVLWALIAYRHPWAVGMWIGLGTALVYYPIFLLPLWTGFYWAGGNHRFWSFWAGTTFGVMLLAGLIFGFDATARTIPLTFGWISLEAAEWNGLWGPTFVPAYRLPVQAAFAALCGSLALWPVSKNLGTMLSGSAAVMLMTQFWHPVGGGAYFTWYVPLLLAVVFRPNLQDRLAFTLRVESGPPVVPGLRAA